MGSYMYVHVHEDVEKSLALRPYSFIEPNSYSGFGYIQIHIHLTQISSNRVIETNLYFLYNENMMALRDSSILIMLIKLNVLTDAHVLERQRNSFNDDKGRDTSFLCHKMFKFIQNI